MSDNLDINPGLKANEIVSPDNLHTEPPFQQPVYGEEPEPEVEPKAEPKAKAPTKVPAMPVRDSKGHFVKK